MKPDYDFGDSKEFMYNEQNVTNQILKHTNIAKTKR